jgi:hypothetical protein
MQRTNQSIGAIASALAAARAELISPEKSLIATIPSGMTTDSRYYRKR